MSTIHFYTIPAHGHINPSLPLIGELVRRGEEVTVYTTESFRAKFEAQGALVYPYAFDNEFVADSQGIAAPMQVAAMILGLGETLLPTLIEKARNEQPNLIIYDSMCPWGKQVAQVIDCPAVCSCSLMYAGPENFRAMPGEPSMLREFAWQLPTVIRSLSHYRQTARRIRQNFAVPSPSMLGFFGNPAEMTLVYTSKAFQIGGELFDERFKFIGPSIPVRTEQADFPLDSSVERPLVYISLGTVFNDRPEFFRTCLEAFAGTSMRVVMSTGGGIDPASLGALPDNFVVRSRVPQLAVLQKAALFITHGGMNSVSESAWFGVPMVVVPQGGDQLFIARRVEQVGAGLRLEPKQLSSTTIREMAERVLANPAYRVNCQKVGEDLRAAGGYQRAADEIAAFMQAQVQPVIHKH